ncbi:MAG: cytochrome P450 [Myxococcota bacterium]|nr:cytochrome P450 [Myxococcota bacterium]
MVCYDPFSDEAVLGDPNPTYRLLRDEAPVYKLENWDAFALSRFEDVWDACSNRNIIASRGTTSSHLLTKVQPVTPMLNTMDPPDHSALRAQVRTLFLPGRMRKLDGLFRKFVTDKLDELSDRNEIDFVSEFAHPLAVFVACTVAGFPLEDGPLMKSLVDRFFHREPGTAGMTADGLVAMEEIFGYFAALSAERRKKPVDGPDSIAVFQNFEDDDGRRASDEEVASHCLLLLIGGTDTLPKALGNTMLRLAEHPEQRARVAADPSLAQDAFLEALRLDMPTQHMMRSTVDDMEVRDVTIPAGSTILLLYASANRDEREFSDAERYVIDRRPPRFLGFSHGTHACLGLHAAKAEARISLEEILARFPNFQIRREGLEKYVTDFVKGYQKIPLQWSE